MVDFKPCFKGQRYRLQRRKDNLVYITTNQYSHDGCPVKYGNKRPLEKRLKVTIIKLRKMGFAQQAIAEFVNRSRSFIHRTLKTASAYDPTMQRLCDMRELPYQTHITQSKNRWVKLVQRGKAWTMFLKAVVEKPP